VRDSRSIFLDYILLHKVVTVVYLGENGKIEKIENKPYILFVGYSALGMFSSG
jgi:hypothetical protein